MGIVFNYIFPLYPIDTCQISAGYVAGIMMPQGFFPLESVHPHTLGIWAEVFMCEYNGYSSNKIYKRCDQIVFLEVAVFMGYSYGAVAWLQSRNHFCESVHDRCVYTSSMGDKPEPMNTSWQHIL